MKLYNSHHSRLVLTIALISTTLLPASAQQTPTQKIKDTANKVLKTTKKVTENAVKTTANAAKNVAVTPLWPALEANYKIDTDAAPPGLKATDYQKTGYVLTKFSFRGASGKTVAGVYLRPSEGQNFPCALALHGLTQSKEVAVSNFGLRLVKNGVAVLALDAPGHGNQRVKGKNLWQEPVIRTGVHDGVLNYRYALNYLMTRPEIDKTRIGLVGLSMGSITGAILGGVDDRISAFALCVGGDALRPVAQVLPAGARRNAEFAVCPSLYVGHIAPRPVLMINGKADPIIVVPAAVLLQQNAQDPKEVVWYNGTHEVPVAMRQKAVDWLVAKLKAEPAEKPEKPETPPVADPEKPQTP